MITTKQFELVGLRHNYYKDQLDALYDSVMGEEVILAIENDNECEPDAVIAYLRGKCLGYVFTNERERAVSAILSLGYDVASTTVTGIDRTKNHLFVEIDVPELLPAQAAVRKNVLTDWVYDGPTLLPCCSTAKQVFTNVKVLTMELHKHPDCWTPKMEDWLADIEQHLCYDISGEMDAACVKLDEMLTALSVRHESFRQAEQRLRYAVAELCSESGRKRLLQRIVENSEGKAMDKLLERLGDEAADVAAKLPEALISELHTDAATLMSRLRYWRVPRVKLQQACHLMSLIMRLEKDGKQIKKRSRKKDLIPDEMVSMFSDDPEASSVLKKFASEQALKEGYPELYAKLNKKQATNKVRPTKTAHHTEPEASDEEDWSAHPLYKYLVKPETASTLLNWLHSMMDEQEQPKAKLKPLRAAYEVGYFTGPVPHLVYCAEFEKMSQSSYSKWMGIENKYDETELDLLIEKLNL